MSKLLFDPELLPVDGVAGEPAIAAHLLHADALHQRFASQIDWQPEFGDESAWRLHERAPTAAAVLLPIVVRPDGLTLLLTQRTAHLTDHGGQISLPGGRTDDNDTSAVDTALRETEEEIGLARSHISVLGSLPDYLTGTGYRVTPIVGLVHPPFTLRPEPYEVAEIFEVPLAFLMNGMHHQRRTVELPGNGGRRTFYAMPYGRFFIWGATAGMLRNLFHFLRAA
ncbi:MAG: CoA pyrophosphatase [Pseudomonadota bacterium]|nr:CoA pyrophosphatase [Pseudomonadota bacterium]